MSEFDPSSALIDLLVTDLTPVRPGALQGKVLGALGISTLPSLAIVLWRWGVRPNIAMALPTIAFWAKEAFVLVLALAGIAAVLRLGRPDGAARGPARIAFGAVIVMALLAVLQLATNPPNLWWHLLMGKTAEVCPWLIMLLALPVLAGALLVMRSMAPTQLTTAGAAAGLSAGGLSALVYSVSCGESTMPFILAWYGVAILTTTLLGAMLGRRVLRW